MITTVLLGNTNANALNAYGIGNYSGLPSRRLCHRRQSPTWPR